MAIIKGRCSNIGGKCQKALSKEIIEADENDFICPECGRILVKAVSPAKPSKSGFPVNTAIAVAGALVLGTAITGICLGWFSSKDDAVSNSGDNVAVVNENTIVPSESTDTVAVSKIQSNPADEAKDKVDITSTDNGTSGAVAVKKTVTSSSNVLNGAATMIGNTITFKRAYRLNLHTIDGDYIDIPADAEILSCKFDGDYLIQGELKVNGESRLLSGIKEKLR